MSKSITPLACWTFVNGWLYKEVNLGSNLCITGGFLLKIVVAILKAHKIAKELIKSKFTYAYNSVKEYWINPCGKRIHFKYN